MGNLMLKSLVEYEEPTSGPGTRELCETRRLHIFPLLIALTYFAAPAPSLAEAGPRENIAIALSNSIVASPVGTGDAPRAVPGALVDYSVAVTGPLDQATPATSFAITDTISCRFSWVIWRRPGPGRLLSSTMTAVWNSALMASPV